MEELLEKFMSLSEEEQIEVLVYLAMKNPPPREG